MGIRKTAGRGRDLAPDDVLPLVDAPSASQRHTAVFRCRLVTPMYGGGVKAGHVDRAMPIRATAIRGQLRHWWRFLNRFDSDGTTLPAKTLFERERAVWGGLGDAKTLTKSKVTIRVLLEKQTGEADLFKARHIDQRNKTAVWDEKVKRAHYALFPAQGKHEKGADTFSEEPDSLLSENLEFTIRLTQSKDLDDEDWWGVLKAVQWWANFGGVGARTRRGLGSILVKDSAGHVLPIPSDKELKHLGCRLGFLPQQANDNRADNNQQDANPSWFRAIEKLKYFRQTADRNTNSARWPESKFIRSISGHLNQNNNDPMPSAFPRAVFGLPIITHFKGSDIDPQKYPQDTELLPIPQGAEVASKRMASPLILRSVYDGKEWRSAALLLPSAHVYAMGLQLNYTHKNGEDKEFKMLTEEWWRADYVKHTPALRADEHAPLIAFIRKFPAIAAKRPDYSPETQAVSEPQKIVLTRPNLTRNNRNGAITIDSKSIKKQIVLIGCEAERCFAELSPYAQKRLCASKPFNRLTITIDGDRFIELQEHAE